MNPDHVGASDAAEPTYIPGYWGAAARQDNVRIRIPTWCQDHVDPPAIIGKSAYRKRDTRLLRRVNQTAPPPPRGYPGMILHTAWSSPGSDGFAILPDQLVSVLHGRAVTEVEKGDLYRAGLVRSDLMRDNVLEKKVMGGLVKLDYGRFEFSLDANDTI